MSDGIYKRLEGKFTKCGGCWVWNAALSSGQVPAMRVPGKRETIAVRRWIAEQMALNCDGKLVTTKCENKTCVNPEHIDVVTRKTLQKRTAKTGYLHTITRAKNLSKAARKRAKITPEIAQRIRESSLSIRAQAEIEGLAKSTISRIRRHEMWKDYTNPFAGLM